MPPIHPAIVHYRIALLTFSVIADLTGYLADSTSLLAVGWWALVGAMIGAAMAIAAGIFDMKREHIDEQTHGRVHTHMKFGFVVFAAIAALTVARWFVYTSRASLGWRYLAAAFLVLGLTFFQGWLGGELVFSEGVGVAVTGQGTEPASNAKARLKKVPATDLEAPH